MFRLTLLLPVVFPCLVSPAPAQTSRPSLPGAPPAAAGVYRMDTGSLLHEEPGSALGPSVLFENDRLSGRYALPAPGEEWVETAILLDRSPDRADQIHAIEFSYCSTLPDPDGNAGSFTLRLYDDWVDGAGPAPGVRSCSYEIQGLPLGGPAGELRSWTVLVILQGGFECTTDLDAKFRTRGAAGRRFGIGFVAHDPETGPILAAGGLGSEDHLDVVDAGSGVFLDQIWFDGSPHAGLAVRLYGNEPGVFRYYAPAPGSEDRLSLLGSSVIPGQVAVWWVEPWTPGRYYWLYAGTQPDDRRFGPLTGLVGGALQPPKPMPGGQLTFFMPVELPPRLYVQAVETTTWAPPTPQDFRAASHALQHVLH